MKNANLAHVPTLATSLIRKVADYNDPYSNGLTALLKQYVKDNDFHKMHANSYELPKPEVPLRLLWKDWRMTALLSEIFYATATE